MIIDQILDIELKDGVRHHFSINDYRIAEGFLCVSLADESGEEFFPTSDIRHFKRSIISQEAEKK